MGSPKQLVQTERCPNDAANRGLAELEVRFLSSGAMDVKLLRGRCYCVLFEQNFDIIHVASQAFAMCRKEWRHPDIQSYSRESTNF